jgi:hypothetical protein
LRRSFCYRCHLPPTQIHFPQALDHCEGIILDASFGSVSGIAARYGLDRSEGPGSPVSARARSSQHVISAILQELEELEEEERGSALQRNREAREVPCDMRFTFFRQ